MGKGSTRYIGQLSDAASRRVVKSISVHRECSISPIYAIWHSLTSHLLLSSPSNRAIFTISIAIALSSQCRHLPFPLFYQVQICMSAARQHRLYQRYGTSISLIRFSGESYPVHRRTRRLFRSYASSLCLCRCPSIILYPSTVLDAPSFPENTPPRHILPRFLGDRTPAFTLKCCSINLCF